MFSIHADFSITICLQPFISAYIKRFRRQHQQRFAVFLKEFTDRNLFFIVKLRSFPLVL